ALDGARAGSGDRRREGLGGGGQGRAGVHNQRDATVCDDVGVRVVVGRQRRNGHWDPGYVGTRLLRCEAHRSSPTSRRAASSASSAGTLTSGSTPRPSQVAPNSGASTPVAIQA